MLASRPGDDNVSRCGIKIIILLCAPNDLKRNLGTGNYWLMNYSYDRTDTMSMVTRQNGLSYNL